MEVLPWIVEQWFELFQTVGIVGGLLLNAYATWRLHQSRKISNLIAIKQEHREIWSERYSQARLSRIREKNVNLHDEPVTDEEEMFINLLILHLDTVHRARKAGMFVNLEGLQVDIKEFFSLPIPEIIWQKAKAFQNRDFVRFVEASRK